jgi:hypothetical protein
MVQAVSRRPFSAEARLRSLGNPRGIYGGESGTGTCFSLSASVFSCQYHFTGCFHTHLGDEQQARWWPQFRCRLAPSARTTTASQTLDTTLTQLSLVPTFAPYSSKFLFCNRYVPLFLYQTCICVFLFLI